MNSGVPIASVCVIESQQWQFSDLSTYQIPQLPPTFFWSIAMSTSSDRQSFLRGMTFFAALMICNFLSGCSAANTWSTTSLSNQRSYLAATSVGAVALFAGGENSTGCFSTVDIYNFTSSSWTHANLWQPRSLLAATSILGSANIALFGGGNNGTGPSAVVDIYSSTSGTWSTASLSQARWYFGAASVGNIAAFGGGSNATGGAVSDVVDIYNVTGNTWKTARLSVARNQLSVVSVANAVILFAGGFVMCRVRFSSLCYSATSSS